MKKIVALLILFTSVNLVIAQSKKLDELGKNLSWNYFKSQNKDLVIIKGDSSDNSEGVMIVEVKGNDSKIDKTTYFFMHRILVISTITYKEGKKPSDEELCKKWGNCEPLRSKSPGAKSTNAVYWKSSTGTTEVYSYGQKPELVFAFGNNILTWEEWSKKYVKSK